MSEKINLVELVQKHWPSAVTDEDVESILLNVTCFPFGTIEKVTEQIIHYNAKCNGDINAAMVLVCEEMSAEHAKFMEQLDNP